MHNITRNYQHLICKHFSTCIKELQTSCPKPFIVGIPAHYSLTPQTQLTRLNSLILLLIRAPPTCTASCIMHQSNIVAKFLLSQLCANHANPLLGQCPVGLAPASRPSGSQHCLLHLVPKNSSRGCLCLFLVTAICPHLSTLLLASCHSSSFPFCSLSSVFSCTQQILLKAMYQKLYCTVCVCAHLRVIST